jgi:hypothetical protein
MKTEEAMQGLDFWVGWSSSEPDLPDLFVADDSRWSFPCCACLHVEGEIAHCKGCRHYSA